VVSIMVVSQYRRITSAKTATDKKTCLLPIESSAHGFWCGTFCFNINYTLNPKWLRGGGGLGLTKNCFMIVFLCSSIKITFCAHSDNRRIISRVFCLLFNPEYYSLRN
jgi:hypothetical protein